jgi:hypothetical protein
MEVARDLEVNIAVMEAMTTNLDTDSLNRHLLKL